MKIQRPGVLLLLMLLTNCNRSCRRADSRTSSPAQPAQAPAPAPIQGMASPRYRLPDPLRPKPQSPWLALAGPPPGNGALGWVRPLHRAILVEWAKDESLEAIDGDELLSYQYWEGSPPDSGPHVGVFDRVDSALLVWGSKGWAWIIQDSEGEKLKLVRVFCPIRSTTTVFYPLSEAAKAGNQDGYSFVVGDTIRLTQEMELFVEPDDSAPRIGVLPRTWARQEARWIVPWSDWQHLDEAGPVPPLKNLSYRKQGRGVPNLASKGRGPLLLKTHEIRGDWALVSQPEPGSTIIAVDNEKSAPIENPGYLIRWTPKPVGWIRWLRPGPVAGTQVCVVAIDWSGIAD